jgi:hypothetical protein
MKLRWRMPDEGETHDCVETGDHISALARAFGHYPITLRPEHEKQLRSMAATWNTMQGNPYYFLANVLSSMGTMVLFLDGE